MEGNRERMSAAAEEAAKKNLKETSEEELDAAVESLGSGDLEGVTDREIDAAADSLQDSSIDIEGAMKEAMEKADAEQAKEDAEVGEVSEQVDEAFENMTERSSADAITQTELGGETASAIQKAFETGDLKGLPGLVEDFKNKGGDVAVLREQLKGFHDAYREAGLDEKASEIDSFSRSLEAKTEVSTDAGKQFMADLEAGKFAGMEYANTALDGLKEAAKGMSAEELEGLNNEFNILFGAATEHFNQLQQEQSGPESGEKQNFDDVSEDELDDVFGALG